MTTNISGDLKILGRDETATATVKTPLGFQTKIEGTIDVIDRSSDALEDNDRARVLVNGKTIADSRKVTYFTDPGFPEVQADDEIIVSDCSDPQAQMIMLPAISTIHPKTYIIEIKTMGTWRGFSADANDNVNKHGAPDEQYGNLFQFKQPGSVEIHSELGTGKGGRNNWRIQSSHNVPDMNGTYKREVEISGDSNQTISNLVVGYSLNGHTLAYGDRILLNAQTDESENGIYEIKDDTDPAERAHDFSTGKEFTHAIIDSTKNHKQFKVISEGIVGTDDVKILRVDEHLREDITQATNFTTDVTTTATQGFITTQSANIVAGAEASFKIVNSSFDIANDYVLCGLQDYNGTGTPIITASKLYAGNIRINVYNSNSLAAVSGALKIWFKIIKTIA